jgi:hypothetical protein
MFSPQFQIQTFIKTAKKKKKDNIQIAASRFDTFHASVLIISHP